MRIIRAFGIGLGCFLAVNSNSVAQVYSSNMVGYYALRLYAGDNLIANQLLSSSDTLSNLFQYQIPDGSTFTKWDAAQNQYLPVSTYHNDTGWDINYGLTLGEGGLFHAPTAFTNVFVGSVWPGFGPDSTLPDFGQPVINGSGSFLLSCIIPVTADFYEVIGRDPRAGESVTTLDPLTQLSTTTTFLDGTWDNGAPTLAIGQSAFFNLGDKTLSVVFVPEPSTLALIGLGATALLSFKRRRKS